MLDQITMLTDNVFDWLIDCWGLTPRQQYFSYIQVMNMKWMINEKGMGHKDNVVDKFWLALEIGSGGYGRAIRPPGAEPKGSYTERIPQKDSLTCEERCIFPNTVHHYSLRSGFPYYGLTNPVCNTPGVPPFHHLGHTTQLLCRQSSLAPGLGSGQF